MIKKTVPGILRFVSILFFNIWKGDGLKTCARDFEIRKYTFLIFEKGDKQKTAPGILKFVSILFLVFEKGYKQKDRVTYFESRKYTF